MREVYHRRLRSVRVIFLLSLFLFLMSVQTRAQNKSNSWLNRFVSDLNPESRPALLLGKAGNRVSIPEKIKILAKYFRDKPYPEPLWYLPASQWNASDIGKADSATEHIIISTYGTEKFGKQLPWFSPDKKVKTLARFPQFRYLAPAYERTQNEKYARAMVRDMMDFVKHAPISKASGFTVQDNYVANPWNWVLLQWRMGRWIDALHYLRKSPSLSDADYLKILLHIWNEIDWLVPRMQLGLHNGTLGNIRAVLYAGLNFPEAKNGLYWKNLGKNDFRFFVNTYFYPGEVSVELTLGYSASVLKQCLGIYDGLPANEKDKATGEELLKVVYGHVGLMKPDRSLPRYGDHGEYDIRNDLLREAGHLFNRKDLLSVANSNNPADPPDFLSYPMKSNPYYLSGYYAMRDNWNRNGQYLSMDAGPFGTNHQHGDKLSITLSADAADFVVDPGTAIYHSTEPGPRYNLRFGFLHSNFTVDGIDENAGWNQHYEFDVLSNRWVTNPEYDFLEGQYHFQSSGVKAVARRTIFYKKGEYWLFFDAVKGSGRHKVESNFQFWKDDSVLVGKDDIVAKASNGAELDIASAMDSLRPQVIIGDTTFPGTTYPMPDNNIDWKNGGRGWVGTFGNHSKYDSNHCYPAPALLFSGKVDLPYYVVRVFSPSKNKQPQPVRVKWLKRTNSYFQVEIFHENPSVKGIHDYFEWYPSGMPQPYQKMVYEKGDWVRTDHGAIQEIIFMNNSKILFDNDGIKAKMIFNRAAEGYLKKTKKRWEIYIDSYLQKPVNLLDLIIIREGKTILNYRNSEKKGPKLMDVNGAMQTELKPGNIYYFVK